MGILIINGFKAAYLKAYKTNLKQLIRSLEFTIYLTIKAIKKILILLVLTHQQVQIKMDNFLILRLVFLELNPK